MLKKLRQFAALDLQQKFLFVQAWFMLGWFRAAILTVSFRRLVRSLEHHQSQPRYLSIENEQMKQQAFIIGNIVAKAARYTPWQSRCLVQVLVVQRLLDKRNIAGQFYLGVRKGEEGENDSTGLSAHAWLQCGGIIVSGGSGHEEFAVVSTFSWG